MTPADGCPRCNEPSERPGDLCRACLKAAEDDRKRRAIAVPEEERELVRRRDAELPPADVSKESMLRTLTRASQRAAERPVPPEDDDSLQHDSLAANGSNVTAPSSTPPPNRPQATRNSQRRGSGRGRKRNEPEPNPPKVDAAALRVELDRLTWGADECAVLARIEWARHHDGAECPLNRMPTPKDLSEWRCPEDADHFMRGETAAILRDIARVLGDSGKPFPGIRLEVTSDSQFGIGTSLDFAPAAPMDPLNDALQRMRTFGGGAAAAAVLTEEGGDVSLSILSMYWHQCPPERRPRHTCGPLVAAWLKHGPVTTEAETRADRRIMPTLRVVGPTPERERGILFGGLIDDRPRSAELSLFPEMEPTLHRVPLLEIVDRTGVPIRSRGRGAPLEARLLVRGGLLMIRPEDRHLETVRIAVTVGELLDGLWPTRTNKRGNLARDTSRNWPRLLDALYRARDWTVPDAGGGRWFPMALRRLPPSAADGRPALDALVVIDLAPVPGAVHGASVDLPWLDRMGVTSGPQWRAYIAGRSLIWLPGTTRRPVPQTGRKRYGWSRNQEDYPMLTLDDLRRLAFGDRDAKNRTRAAILAPWLDLPDLTLVEATDPRTGVRGWRLLPTDRGEGL